LLLLSTYDALDVFGDRLEGLHFAARSSTDDTVFSQRLRQAVILFVLYVNQDAQFTLEFPWPFDMEL
jgi:hypothetical protein